MSDEAKVDVVFLVPTDSGSFRPEKFKDVTINIRAPIERLKPELIHAFPEVNIGSSRDVDIMVQAPDGSTLSNVEIQDHSTIILFPKFSGPLVKR